MKKMVSACLICLSLYAQSQEISLGITNCNVITMKSDKVLYHQTILISNGKISKIIPAKSWINHSNVKTIDAAGGYVMPALTDMHIHVNGYSQWVFELLLSYGITTIRVMAGNEASLKWRDSIRNHLKIAPDLHVASQLLDGYPPAWGDLHEGPIVRTPDSVEFIISDQISRGYEFIKVYNRLEAAVIKKIREVCHQKNIKLAGHIPIRLSKEEMFTDQTGEIEHLSGYARYASNRDTVSSNALNRNTDLAYDLELAGDISPKKMQMAARETKAHQIWNCPTMVVSGIKSDSMYCKQLPETAIAQKLSPVLGWWKSQGYNFTANEKKLWEFKKAMLRELYFNKALLLAGSDSPAPWVVPGLSLHQELQYMVAAGLSNYDALKTATVNPALWFGKNYDKGSIESGKRADLIILSGNPLEDIRNTQKIVAVIFKGKRVE